jgi:hypothetical protein
MRKEAPAEDVEGKNEEPVEPEIPVVPETPVVPEVTQPVPEVVAPVVEVKEATLVIRHVLVYGGDRYIETEELSGFLMGETPNLEQYVRTGFPGAEFTGTVPALSLKEGQNTIEFTYEVAEGYEVIR